MGSLVDFTGWEFGRLEVLRRKPAEPGKKVSWVCLCRCGNIVTVLATNLKMGYTKSCGCLHKEAVRDKCCTHDLSDSPEYNSWSNIKARCYNTKSRKYKDYGGRGILMCDEWRDSFEAFYRDMGPRPSPAHTVDRRDNDKGYSKENCRWATYEEQNNNRRTSIFVEFNGVIRTLSRWCRELGLNYNTVYQKVQRGLTFEEAIRE